MEERGLRPFLLPKNMSHVTAHEKTAIKRENGLDFPPRDYAYVPNPALPATWQLRLTETPGVISLDQLARAAAALSVGGYRGSRVDIPSNVLSSVKRRIQAEYRRLGASDAAIPNSVKGVDGEDESNGLMVWKEVGTGRTRWLAVYSNNFRDDDNPSEIISEKSQTTFVRLVDEGFVDYPELWLWHIKGSAWGKADWLAYSDGFAIASGYIYPGYEWLAESLAKQKNLRVSHGMPEALLVYRQGANRVIDFHVTTEISPLPGWAAANRFTSFDVIKGENTMPLPDDKKVWLKELGLEDEAIGKLEANITATGRLATEMGIESKSKEASEDEVEVAAVQTEESDSTEEDETEDADVADESAEKAKPAFLKDEEEDKDEKKPAKKPKKKEAAVLVENATPMTTYVTPPNYATRDEVAQALTLVVAPLLDSVTTLTNQVATMTKEMKALKATDAEKIAATKEVTPTRSLVDMLTSQNLIGKEATRVDGRTTMGKDAPVETPAQKPRAYTPVGVVNDLIENANKQRA